MKFVFTMRDFVVGCVCVCVCVVEVRGRGKGCAIACGRWFESWKSIVIAPIAMDMLAV